MIQVITRHEIFCFGISFSSEKYIYLVTPEIRFYLFCFSLEIAFVRKSEQIKVESVIEGLWCLTVCRMFKEHSTEQWNCTTLQSYFSGRMFRLQAIEEF